MEMMKKGLFGPREFYKSALTIAVPIMLQALIQSLAHVIFELARDGGFEHAAVV